MLEALARGLTQKMLHGALAELHAAEGAQREQLAQTVSRLFLRQTTRSPDGDEPLAPLRRRWRVRRRAAPPCALLPLVHCPP